MSKALKQVQSEIWSLKGEATFSGKDTLVIVNRFTGVTSEYELVKKSTDESVIIKNDGSCDNDTDEYYGNNGFNRARWIEGVIDDQTTVE
tara:strand:- start:464 stop:733 length:270 start_codon:yes stop_codon:yes gene_type:complete